MGELKTDFDKTKEIFALQRKDRSLLAAAMLEDEAVRLGSEKRAKDFMDKVEGEKDHMPEWMWNLLFFALGMLFMLSEPAWFKLIYDFIKIYNGGNA